MRDPRLFIAPLLVLGSVAIAQQPPNCAVGGFTISENGTLWVCKGAGTPAEQVQTGGVWGAITGTLASQTDLQTALTAKQATAAKGAANGYAGLDGAGLVPLANLPSIPAAWGAITGVLSAQLDLQAALDAKAAKSANLSDLANAGTARTNLGLGTLATQNGTFSGTSSGTNTGDQTITLTGAVTGTGTGSFATTYAGVVPFAQGGISAAAATSATSGTMTVNMTAPVITITPTGAATFNASGGVAGQIVTFSITTSGTSSFVLTWGTNFRKTGTLATGTVSARFFAVTFRCIDGTMWLEISRTAVQT